MHKKASGLATHVAEKITHKDIDGDGEIGSKTADTVVDAAEQQSGMDLDGDGKIAHQTRPDSNSKPASPKVDEVKKDE